MEAADSVYDKTRPWQSNEERLTRVALRAAAFGVNDTDAIRAIRPPIPRMGYMPPRFGYGPRLALSVRDVVNADDVFAGSRVDYSQSQSGYGSTSTPALNVM
jgi:hypothetical protein